MSAKYIKVKFLKYVISKIKTSVRKAMCDLHVGIMVSIVTLIFGILSFTMISAGSQYFSEANNIFESIGYILILPGYSCPKLSGVWWPSNLNMYIYVVASQIILYAIVGLLQGILRNAYKNMISKPLSKWNKMTSCLITILFVYVLVLSFLIYTVVTEEVYEWNGICQIEIDNKQKKECNVAIEVYRQKENKNNKYTIHIPPAKIGLWIIYEFENIMYEQNIVINTAQIINDKNINKQLKLHSKYIDITKEERFKIEGYVIYNGKNRIGYDIKYSDDMQIRADTITKVRIYTEENCRVVLKREYYGIAFE